MAAFRLPRLPVNWKEQPQLFERYWDETLLQIEKTLNAILAIPIIQQAVADAQAAAELAQQAAETAQSAAEGAQSSAGGAQDTADSTRAEASLVNSYVGGFTGTLITSSIAGFVTIKAHSRIYGDTTMNPTVSVNAGTLSTGHPAGSVIRIYYSDPARAGGAVTYQYTVDGESEPPVQGKNIHSVGAVVVPSSGTGNGKVIRQPGYVEV